MAAACTAPACTAAPALAPSRAGALRSSASKGVRGTAVISSPTLSLRPSAGRRGVRVMAKEGGDGKKDGPDWDGAWSSFKKSIDEAMPDMEQYVDRVDAPPPMYMDNVDEAREQIKRDERAALDLWSSPLFTRLGYATLVVTFIFMVFIVGPPPS